jgi:hypothetical protein
MDPINTLLYILKTIWQVPETWEDNKISYKIGSEVLNGQGYVASRANALELPCRPSGSTYETATV